MRENLNLIKFNSKRVNKNRVNEKLQHNNFFFFVYEIIEIITYKINILSYFYMKI